MWTQRPEEKRRERLRVRIVSSRLWCLTLVDSAKTENHRDVRRERKKKNLSVGCCTTTPRLRNPSHMLMGCHLAPKSTEGRSEQYPLHYRQSQWSKCVKTEKWPNFSRIQFFLSATQWRMHLATCQGAWKNIRPLHPPKNNTHTCCIWGFTVGSTNTIDRKKNSSNVSRPTF